MNDRIKYLIKKEKSYISKTRRVKHSRSWHLKWYHARVIKCYKLERLAIKLNDPKTAPKTYWVILITFANASKIPLIPPVLVNNEFVTDFLVNANLFNDFFKEQCRPIANDSSFPHNQIIETVNRLSEFNIDTDTVIKNILSLDPNKADDCDEISIHMLKLCATWISKPLHILFDNSIINECFPNEWKKANTIPVHKKGGMRIIKNYRTVSLLPISSKVFEKIMFNYLFKYLEEN